MKRLFVCSIAAIGLLAGLAVQGVEPAGSASSDSSKAAKTAPDNAIRPEKDKIASTKPAAPSFDKTDQYDVLHIEGWKILVNKKLQPAAPEVYDKAMKQLGVQLYNIQPGSA